MSTTADRETPARKVARIVVTFRMALTGKQAAIQHAEARGYANYTEWIRDLIAAEVQSPKHNLRPKPKGKP